MRTKGWIALLLCCVVVVCCSCSSERVAGGGKDEGLYTRYNLHYVAEKGTAKGSFANWTDWPGHSFVPYSSKVHVAVRGNRIQFVTEAGQEITWEFNPRSMGMSSSAYIALITSPVPVTYENLSDVDRQGIQAGKALVGMSKEGVKIALGYPAKHRTPSLDDNRWTYWKGRYDTYVVEFDGSGKVVRIGK